MAFGKLSALLRSNLVTVVLGDWLECVHIQYAQKSLFNFRMTKRVAEKQITKDNPDSSSDGQENVDTRRDKAPEEVLAKRKILTVRRAAPKESIAAEPKASELPKSAPTGGLFSGLSGLASTEAKTGNSSPKGGLFAGLSGLAADESKKEEKSPKGLFAGLASAEQKESPSSGNLFASMFTAPAATGGLFTSSAFSFTAPENKGDTGAFPSFGESPEASEEEEEEQEPEPAVPAGQSDELEGEEQTFQCDCKLFKLTKETSSESMKWVEKCIGFVRLLKNKEQGTVRLVVRMKGVYRLILNIALVDKICRAEKVGNKSVRFNGIEDGTLGMFRVNLLTEDQQAAFWDQLPDSLKQQ